MRIFIRQRRHAGPGAARPQFAVVAVEGDGLTLYRPWLRKSELEFLAQTVGAEIITLPAGGEGEGGKRQRREMQEAGESED